MEQEIAQIAQQKAVYDAKTKELEAAHAQVCNDVMELSKQFESLRTKYSSYEGSGSENFKQSIIQKYQEIFPEYMKFKYNRFCSEVGEIPQKTQGKSEKVETIEDQLNTATSLLIQLNTELENLEKKRNQLLSDCEKHKNDMIAIKQDMEPLKIQAEKELRQSRRETLEILHKTNYINLDQINKRLQYLSKQLQEQSETSKIETRINTNEATIGYQKVALNALNYVSTLLRNDPNSMTPEQIDQIKKYTEEMNKLYTFQNPQEFEQELTKSKDEMTKLVSKRDQAIQKINKLMAAFPILINHEKSLRDQVDDVKTYTDMIQYEQKQVTSKIKRVEYDIRNKDESLYQSYWDLTRKLTDKKYVLLINYSQNTMTDEKEKKENDKRDKELAESKKKQAHFDELMGDPKHNQDQLVKEFLQFIKTNDDEIEKQKDKLVVQYQPQERSDAKAFANLKAKEAEERNKKQEKELKQKTDLEKKNSKALQQLEIDFNSASTKYVSQFKDLPNPNSDVKKLLDDFTSKISTINKDITTKNQLIVSSNPKLRLQFNFAEDQLGTIAKDGVKKITNVPLIYDFLPRDELTISRDSIGENFFYCISKGNLRIVYEALFNKLNIDPLYPMALFALSLLQHEENQKSLNANCVTYLLNSIGELIHETLTRNELSTDVSRSFICQGNSNFPYVFDRIFQYFAPESSVELVLQNCIEFIVLIADYQLLNVSEISVLSEILNEIEEKSQNEIKALAHSVKSKLGIAEEQSKKAKRQTVTKRQSTRKVNSLSRQLPKVVEVPSKVKAPNFIDIGAEIYYNTLTHLQYLQYLNLCTSDIFHSSSPKFQEYQNFFKKTKEYIISDILPSFEKDKKEKRRVFDFWYEIGEKAHYNGNYFFFKAISEALNSERIKATNDEFQKENAKEDNPLFKNQDIDPDDLRKQILTAKFSNQPAFLFIPDPGLFTGLRHAVKKSKHHIKGDIVSMTHFRNIAANIYFLQYGQEAKGCEFQINIALQKHFKDTTGAK